MLVLLGSREYSATVAGWVSRVIGKRFRLLRWTNRSEPWSPPISSCSSWTRREFSSKPLRQVRQDDARCSFAGPSQHSLFGFFLVNFAALTHLENDRSTPKSSSFHTEHHRLLKRRRFALAISRTWLDHFSKPLWRDLTLNPAHHAWLQSNTFQSFDEIELAGMINNHKKKRKKGSSEINLCHEPNNLQVYGETIRLVNGDLDWTSQTITIQSCPTGKLKSSVLENLKFPTFQHLSLPTLTVWERESATLSPISLTLLFVALFTKYLHTSIAFLMDVSSRREYMIELTGWLAGLGGFVGPVSRFVGVVRTRRALLTCVGTSLLVEGWWN